METNDFLAGSPARAGYRVGRRGFGPRDGEGHRARGPGRRLSGRPREQGRAGRPGRSNTAKEHDIRRHHRPARGGEFRLMRFRQVADPVSKKRGHQDHPGRRPGRLDPRASKIGDFRSDDLPAIDSAASAPRPQGSVRVQEGGAEEQDLSERKRQVQFRGIQAEPAQGAIRDRPNGRAWFKRVRVGNGHVDFRPRARGELRPDRAAAAGRNFRTGEPGVRAYIADGRPGGGPRGAAQEYSCACAPPASSWPGLFGQEVAEIYDGIMRDFNAVLGPAIPAAAPRSGIAVISNGTQARSDRFRRGLASAAQARPRPGVVGRSLGAREGIDISFRGSKPIPATVVVNALGSWPEGSPRGRCSTGKRPLPHRGVVMVADDQVQ